MYDETCCFDPKSMEGGAEDGFSQTLMMAGSTQNNHNTSFEVDLRMSMEELSYPPTQEDDAKAVEIELQRHLGFRNNNNNNNTHFMQEVIQVGMSFDHDHHSNWDPANCSAIDTFTASSLPTPDLLNLFNLPRCSSSGATTLLPNSSISFANPTANNSVGFVGDLPAVDSASGSSVLYDPLLHLNLPLQPPLFRDLFQSLPHRYSLGSVFGDGGDEQREGSGVVYPDGDGRQFDHNTGVLEFGREMANCMLKGKNGKFKKHFATERQRRENLNGKYADLRSLVPNPNKKDRASIVGDAIEYIKELLRTVNELKILVEKKRCGRERSKRRKVEDEGGAGEVESSNIKTEPGDKSYCGSSLRSSWLQRRSKETEIDVHIIDDEVTIKLVQRKKIINCLLFVSKALEDLRLNLHHLAGGHVGDYHCFLFNTKEPWS